MRMAERSTAVVAMSGKKNGATGRAALWWAVRAIQVLSVLLLRGRELPGVQ
jgi:hypothetical protein